jgi:hypothetical protein
MSRPTKSKRRPTPAIQDDEEQSRMFIERAREIEADKQHSDADRLIGHLAKKPPEPRKKSK